MKLKTALRKLYKLFKKKKIIIKSWKEDFLPQYALTDYCAEEINAMENVFPGIVVLLEITL